MFENQHTAEKQWFVMRAYKRERKAEELLSGKHGLPYFIPKKTVMRTREGKKVLCTEPVIHSLVFVYASQPDIVAFKRDIYNELQFVIWKTEGKQCYLTVPDGQMQSFISVCEQKEKEVTFYRPEEIQLEKGKRVKVHGGTFDGVEGHFVKVAKKRGRQLVVIIPEILAASAEVDLEYLEILDHP